MNYDHYHFKVAAQKQVRVIMDSDAKNEADDQFALVQGLLSPKLDHVGMIAAHYGTGRHHDSMERSYREMEVILDKMGMEKKGLIYRGADRPLPDPKTPVESEGARLIIKEALKEDNRPLYVCFMGPLTDMASAYLMEPTIASRVIVIWIGGGAYPEGGPEFNLGNDIHAANVVFGSDMQVWQVPKNVYEMIPVTLAELEYRVRPCGEVGAYLCDQLMEHAMTEEPRKSAFRTGECWVLGDSPAVGLILYEDRFSFEWKQAPSVGADMNYIHSGRFRPIRVYQKIDSRLILEDFYAKLALFAKRQDKTQ